jgi:predicted DNA-binding transcriptional regulator YafY
MINNSRTNRISFILTKLSKGENLTTQKLAQQFETTTRIIQLDFKEYIVPLFCNDTIYYNHSEKCFSAKYPFLQSSLLNSEELATIAILKNKSQDKFADEELSLNTEKLFEKLEESLKNSIYKLPSIETIEENQADIIKVKNAIKTKTKIECIYNDKKRELYPLKILNLDSFWYLINYDLDEDIISGFDNAINAYFEPHIKPFAIELFLDNKVSKYFLRKPINQTQRVLKTYEDESIDIEVFITDFMEIIPLIQSYIPYIMVISPDELNKTIKSNLEEYFSKTT